jgi:putative transposase
MATNNDKIQFRGEAEKEATQVVGQMRLGGIDMESKDITNPLSTVGAVVAQPETQVVLEEINDEMETANSPEYVGLTLREGSPRL